MTSENPVYIRFEYKEALRSRRDLLASQIALLKIAGTIKHHRVLRSQETELKSKLSKAVKELKTNIGKMQRALPKPKIPDILHLEGYEQETKKSTPTKPRDESLEEQLQEIQRKLNELQGGA